MSFTIGSLFDGSGGFPLAAFMCEGTPVWASEVEPYPIAVTKTLFPYMKHLGSVTDIKGNEVEPVDLITFGSPCQDLSVAGKRAGLKHTDNGDDETTRSGLFMEAVRIIREMREATGGKYPRFALWENVPGAFSSNKGEDFRVVCEELIKVVEPSAVMPAVPQKGWNYADYFCGDGWSLAYRVLDAQYWGVPQRRRRIYLVLDLGGERAGEVLFKREGLRGYFEEGRTPWQTAPGDAENCTGAADSERVCVTLEPGIAVVEQCLFENHSQDSRYKGPLDVCPMLPAKLGTGGNNQPFVVKSTVYESHPMDSRIKELDETAPTVSVKWHKGAADTPLVCENHSVYCLQGNGIDRADNAGCNGAGWREGQSYTLNTIDRPAVAYSLETFHCVSEEELTTTLKARDYKDPVCVAYGVDCRNSTEYPELNGCIQADTYKNVNSNGIVRIQYIVRRLTPTECARLQGFPDRWATPDQKDDLTDEEYEFWLNVRNTHAEINSKAVKDYTKAQMLTWYNKLHTDSAEYKLWGNGIALPTALYVMQGIAEVFK
jgi:DNA (cytosine-5)-methyltransferase 1